MDRPSLDQHLHDLPTSFGRAARDLFPIDPRTHYLNHGGYGVTPTAVAGVQRDWRARIEANPTRFFVKENLLPLVRQSAATVAQRLGGRGEDWVFTANATDGANAILRSLELAPGDEILMTDHGYNALRQTALHVATSCGATIRSVTLPWPDTDEESVLRAIGDALGKRTRLLMIDHISSPTSLVLPVARIAATARSNGTLLLVDGAHAPGHLELDVPALGADWYIGNLHKWAFVPRGCGVLWTRPELQPQIHPTTISHGYRQGYTAEFDWQGTRDFSGILAVPEAFQFIDRIGGAASIAAYNKGLIARFAERLQQALGTNQGTPAAMRGFATTIALGPHHPATPEHAHELREALFRQHRVEAPIFPLNGRLWLRVAAQIYLEPEDLPAGFETVLS